MTVLASVIQTEALSVQRELACVKLTQLRCQLEGDCWYISLLARRPRAQLALPNQEISDVCDSGSHRNLH